MFIYSRVTNLFSFSKINVNKHENVKINSDKLFAFEYLNVIEISLVVLRVLETLK